MLTVLMLLCGEPLSIGAYAAEKPTNTRDSPLRSVTTISARAAYAEYLAVKPAVIARKPSNLSFEEAASVPMAAQTAWEGIFTHGHLEKGQTILIHGGAGAVGAYAVQLA
jgi:NADPH:quinone reductase-like Zn-dependent oxidoreductase